MKRWEKGPKVVKVNLKKSQQKKPPKKNKTSQSKYKEENKFKLPIAQLKKSLGKDKNVWDEISKHSQAKKLQLQQMKEEQEQWEQFQAVQYGKIKRECLQICEQLFTFLDSKKTGLIGEEEIKNLKEQKLKQLVEVVYWRKRKSNLFDFIYALWDSQRLEKVCNLLKNQ